MAIPTNVLSQLVDDCPLFRVMVVLGERWSFLILRLTFAGVHHFDQFQSILGIARNILADRLSKLVENGVLERTPSDDDRRRVIYRLTEKGEALLPALVALRQWGEVWEPGPGKPVIIDKSTGQPIQQVVVLAADGRRLMLDDLDWVDHSELEKAS
jgi:DNA-binding HxlR family transcriptional regulator